MFFEDFLFCASWGHLGRSWSYVLICMLLFSRMLKKHCKNAVEMSPNIGQDGSRWLQVGSKLAHVGPSWGDFEAMLAYVGASWGHLKIAWNHLKIAWKVGSKILILYCFLQCFWAPSLAKMAPSWIQVGPCWAKLGRFWGYVGLCWRILGPCWAILKLCWDMLSFLSGEERIVLMFTVFLSPNMNLTWHREREAR